MAELFTIPMTGDDGIEHRVTDEDVQAHLHTDGRYPAMCGTTVRVASLLRAPGRRCGRCALAIAQIANAAAATIPEQPRGTRWLRRAGRRTAAAGLGR